MESSDSNQQPESIRVSDALGGESTQETGSDAANMASAEDSMPSSEPQEVVLASGGCWA